MKDVSDTRLAGCHCTTPNCKKFECVDCKDNWIYCYCHLGDSHGKRK